MPNFTEIIYIFFKSCGTAECNFYCIQLVHEANIYIYIYIVFSDAKS